MGQVDEPTHGSDIGSLTEVEEFRLRARKWLSEQEYGRFAAPDRHANDVSVFHRLSYEDERKVLDNIVAWQRLKFDTGYGALTWPVEYGGAGLDAQFERAFAEEEARLIAVPKHELFSVTMHLIAPTIRLLGTDKQRTQLIPGMLRGESLACQLFSEPGAGSDLASLGTRAVRAGDDWVLTGQKVWTSGAQFANWGEVIARTDPDVPKHAGMTAFMIPMDLPGVEVRPIKQMSGGTSFNEVFLTDVRIPDSLRLGAIGDGWKVALTTLGFERGGNSNTALIGGQFSQLVAMAEAVGRMDDPQVRRHLAEVYIHQQLAKIAKLRDQSDRESGRPPGATGSIRKVQWVNKLRSVSDAAREVLGRRLLADSGDSGAFGWTEHVLGAPGYRIAGGSDEIQRNIIAERVLGLPPEVRPDRSKTWRESVSGVESRRNG